MIIVKNNHTCDNTRMHLFLVILISLLATVENMIPSIVGFQKAPSDTVFLGTVHHANDYFYYLSQFAQGQSRSLTTTNLYSSENTPDTFIGWSNVLTGRIFHLLGIPAIPAYQISIAIWTFLLCLSAYKLALVVFKNKNKALLSLILFVLYHSFPIIVDNHWTYADYWNNFSVPRVRFGGVPHQLLLNTLSVLTLSWLLQKKRILMALSAFFLSSLQPILWLLIVVSSGITTLFQYLQKPKKSFPSIHYSLFTIHSFFPTLLLFLSGLPAAIYLNKIFSTLPFSQLKIWEASQLVPLKLPGFFLAMGPIFIIALLSLYIFLWKRNYERFVIFMFALLSLSFLMSPIPQMFGFTNIRFMSTLAILCICLIAADGLMHIKSRILYISLIFALGILVIPNHIRTVKMSSDFSPSNAYEYLSKSDFDFLSSIKAIGKPQDTFLVLWPYNMPFPALTAKKSYHGHPLLTINPSIKNANAAAFYDQNLTDRQIRQFLKDNNIRYVIAYPWQTSLNQLSYLKVLQQTNNLALFEVLLENL